ncbi:hypothetical protein [Streptomyces sp. WELS2]|uniref:hypothetical protein n=1 Tax=Streptomyces sp. WELS2 TaxID=2749435 RepID=UPI0015F0D0EC|nr:hypothetical protein [Streptomyces sp. WELS2]
MKRLLAGVFGAAVLASGALVANAGTAQAVPQACRTPWTDGTTYGVSCSGGPYIAVAQCKNGQWVQGASASNYSWSYAYCSTVGSTYKSGTGYVLYL